MSDQTVELKDEGLKALIKAFKNIPKAKVGILADKNARKEGANSNVQIGRKHEFGDHEVPKRSFLRMPITDNLQKYLEKSGAFDKEVLAEVIRLKNITPWVEKMAITAVAIVSEGFDTGGFGKWKPSNFENKKVHLTLVETQQLRNSIGYEVNES